MRLVLAAALLLAAGPALAVPGRQPPPRRPSPREASGARIAKAYCGECHATAAAGQSPLADAPPFRQLNWRIPEGGLLTDLLSEGMIVTPGAEDEAGPRRHPRMPQIRLDDAQVGDLLAYLRSIQKPAPNLPPRRRPPAGQGPGG